MSFLDTEITEHSMVERIQSCTMQLIELLHSISSVEC